MALITLYNQFYYDDETNQILFDGGNGIKEVFGTAESVEAALAAIEQVEAQVEGKVDKVVGKGLSTEDYTTADKETVASIPAQIQTEAAERTNADIQLQAQIDQTVQLVNALEGGIYNANPTDTPLPNVNIYNANAAGTYTNFSGVVVNTADITNGKLTQLRRTNGVWIKYTFDATTPGNYVSSADFNQLNDFVTKNYVYAGPTDTLTGYTLLSTSVRTRINNLEFTVAKPLSSITFNVVKIGTITIKFLKRDTVTPTSVTAVKTITYNATTLGLTTLLAGTHYDLFTPEVGWLAGTYITATSGAIGYKAKTQGSYSVQADIGSTPVPLGALGDIEMGLAFVTNGLSTRTDSLENNLYSMSNPVVTQSKVGFTKDITDPNNANLFGTGTILNDTYVRFDGVLTASTGRKTIRIPIDSSKTRLYVAGNNQRSVLKGGQIWAFYNGSTLLTTGQEFWGAAYNQPIPAGATFFYATIKFADDPETVYQNMFVGYSAKPKVNGILGYDIDAQIADYSPCFYQYSPTDGNTLNREGQNNTPSGRMIVYFQSAPYSTLYHGFFIDHILYNNVSNPNDARANSWRIFTGYEYTYDPVANTMTQGALILATGENEFTFIEVGAKDDVFGYHGDEKFSEVTFFANDLPFFKITSVFNPAPANTYTYTYPLTGGNNNAIALTACKSFSYLQKSDGIRCPQEGVSNNPNDPVFCTNWKRSEFIRGGYITENTISFLNVPAITYPMRFTAVYPGLFCVGVAAADWFYNENFPVTQLTHPNIDALTTVGIGESNALLYTSTNKRSVKVTAECVKVIRNGIDVTDFFNKKVQVYDQRDRDEDAKVYFRWLNPTEAAFYPGDVIKKRGVIIFART